MAYRSQLFADIDSMEPDRFAAHLADDVVMRFGNADPVRGRDAVRDAWAQFCDGVDGVSHTLVEQWEADPATVVEANVTYTRKDGGTVTCPWSRSTASATARSATTGSSWTSRRYLPKPG